MATVVKNFRIKSGLIVEGTTGTINNQNILTETGGDSYILNLVGGPTLVKSVDTGVFNVDNAGNLTINANTFDAYGAASAAQAAAEATAATDATSKANAAQTAAEATASADATSKANAAQSAAATDATSKANAAQAAAEATASADATSKANAAEAAAITAAALDATSKANAAQAAANLYTDGAVSALVDSAPELLNTLNELAEALGDSPDTITNLTTLVGTKADTSYVNSEISDLDTAAQGYASAAQTAAEATASADATSKANAAQTAAEATASADATSKANAAQSAAEATAQAALDDVLDGTTEFTALNINDLSSQRAAQGVVPTAQTGSSVMSWSKSDYGTAKAWVKFATATHSQISEVLLTTDSSNNIAITEFGMVGTNGSLGSVGASYLNGNLAIEVDTVHANTTVTVVATLIK
jgi:membrane protein involved in colicin uptake